MSDAGKILSETALKELIKKLNERLYKWDDDLTDMQNEIVDIFDTFNEALGPIIRDYYQSPDTSERKDDE